MEDFVLRCFFRESSSCEGRFPRCHLHCRVGFESVVRVRGISVAWGLELACGLGVASPILPMLRLEAAAGQAGAQVLQQAQEMKAFAAMTLPTKKRRKMRLQSEERWRPIPAKRLRWVKGQAVAEDSVELEHSEGPLASRHPKKVAGTREAGMGWESALVFHPESLGQWERSSKQYPAMTLQEQKQEQVEV